LKAKLDLPAGDPAREERQIARLRTLAGEAKLDPVFAEKLFKFIVDEVIRNHISIKEAE
jgi:chorismate mutase